VTLALVTALAGGAFAISGCGEDEPEPVPAAFTSTPSPTASGVTTYTAAGWGVSLSYESTDFALRTVESTSQLELGPSLLSDDPLTLAGLQTLDVTLELADATPAGPVVPQVSLTARRLPFSTGEDAEGLVRLVLDQTLAGLEKSLAGVLIEEPRSTDLGGAAVALEVEAVGDDAVAEDELHVRAIVATVGRYLYVARATALDATWAEVEPALTSVLDSVRLEGDDELSDLSAGDLEYVNDRYHFALTLPAGFPLVRNGEDPSPQLEFGAEFTDVSGSPLVAVSVGVAEAPGSVGNSQSRVMQAFYREAVDKLREEPTVVEARDPEAIKMNGATAWLIDVTKKTPDGDTVRTRTYDVWHDDYVYSIVAQGRATDWVADWSVLNPIIESFRIV